MTQYVLYRRLSKEDCTKVQHGFDSQMVDIEHFLSSEKDSEVVGSFHEFVSGAADHKPELEKALALCKETGATLLIAKLDRYSRRVSQIALLIESNIDLRVALMPTANTLQLHIYASLAEEERKMIRDRVIRGIAVTKAKGTKCGAASEKYQANKKAGLHSKARVRNTEKQRQALQPVAAEVTKIISYSNGALTLDEISNKLNEQGMLTTRNNPWTKATVSKLIKQFNIEKPRLNKWGSV